jgi:hypothetical protein
MEMVFVVHHVEFNGFGFARSNGRFVQIAVLLMREYFKPPTHTEETIIDECILTNQLIPWRQNPKVHHRVHNSPPPVPVLSQLNPLHTRSYS